MGNLDRKTIQAQMEHANLSNAPVGRQVGPREPSFSEATVQTVLDHFFFS